MKRKKGKQKVNSIKSTLDGIKFQSKLEEFSYKELKAEGLYGVGKLLYEPKQFVIVPPFEYDGKKYQSIKITPDFVDEENKIVFEIKGLPNETFPMRWKLMKKYFKETGENWKVFIGMKNQTNVKLEIIKIKEYYKNVQSSNIRIEGRSNTSKKLRENREDKSSIEKKSKETN